MTRACKRKRTVLQERDSNDSAAVAAAASAAASAAATATAATAATTGQGGTAVLSGDAITRRDSTGSDNAGTSLSQSAALDKLSDFLRADCDRVEGQHKSDADEDETDDDDSLWNVDIGQSSSCVC